MNHFGTVIGIASALCAGFFLGTFPVLAAETTARTEVSLRAAPATAGETITLGEIFDGAGRAGTVQVTTAPRPGRSILIDAKSLGALLAANNLSWPDASRYTAVRVERLSRDITPGQISEAVAAAIARQSGRAVEVRLAQSALVLHAPVTALGSTSVEIVAYDARSGSFDAIVRAPGGDDARVSGIAEEVMEIPVLARPVQRGEVITEADITTIRSRIMLLSRNTVTDVKQLAGLSAKRPLRSGQPLQLSDVEHPLIVAKGSLVTIVYEVPGLSLTNQGRALEAGAMGDTISVLNPESHRTLLATVVASDRVRLEPSGPARATLAQR